jgi:peptidoglycan-N-acetylglucosamine deacetylase
VLWQTHHPTFRFLLLAANGLFPPVFLTCLALRAWTPFTIAISLAALSHALLFIAIFHPRCPWLGPVVRRFGTDRKAVWLTLDDGPDGDRTVQLAEQLRNRNVRATFFLIGQRVREHAGAVAAVLAAGHTIANHSDTHPIHLMWCAGSSRLEKEISRGAEALGPHHPANTWFRAPVGHKSPFLHSALRKNSARLIAWTAGGRDRRAPAAKMVVARVLAAARPGAILMLHECCPHSVSTILAVVDALLAQGYEFTIPAEADLL